MAFIFESGIIGPLYVSVVFSFFLFLLSFVTVKLKRFDSYIINFTSGLMFTYLFMTLLPDIFVRSQVTESHLVTNTFFMFIGYIAFYIAEKRVFESTKIKTRVQTKIFDIRRAGFYVLHFITGYLIIYTFQEKDLLSTLLVLIPFTFHILATSFLFEDLDKWKKDALDSRFLFPFLIVIGSVSAIITTDLFSIDIVYFYSFFGGTYIYLVMSILTPDHKHGTLTSFFLGIFFYFVLLLLGSGVA